MTLLNFLLVFTSFFFFGGLFQVSYICLLKREIILLFPFQLGCLCFYSCLIALSSLSRIMWNRRIESGQTCPPPDLRGNAFDYPLLSMMLSCGLVIYGMAHIFIKLNKATVHMIKLVSFL